MRAQWTCRLCHRPTAYPNQRCDDCDALLNRQIADADRLLSEWNQRDGAA